MSATSQMLRMVQLAKSTTGTWLLHETRFRTSTAVLAAARARPALVTETAAGRGESRGGERRGATPLLPSRLLRIGMGLCGTALFIELSGNSVRCAPQPIDRTPEVDNNPGEPKAAFDLLGQMDMKEMGVQTSLGSVAGFCSGYAVKKVSKVAAFAVGVGFISVQLLRYYGLINEVHWESVESKLVKTFDADGDGKLTAKDVQLHVNNLIAILGFNLPSGASFAACFILGLRYG